MNKKIIFVSCLAILGSALAFKPFTTTTSEKEEEKSWGGLRAIPSYRYSTTDIGSEAKASTVYDYNFKYMGLGGSTASSSSVWYDYRGETTDGDPVTVAVIDSGIDIYHEDFLTSDAKGVSLTQNNVSQYSILDPKSCYIYDTSEGYYTSSVKTDVGIKYAYDDETYDDYYDEYYSHGTAAAACIGAAVNGVGGFGIAPKVNLLIIKMDFWFTSLDVAIRYAADNGADVINMSLGAYAESFTDGFGDKQTGDVSVKTALKSAIDYAHNKDCVVVAAAGNELTNKSSYPACNSGVVGVGALEEKNGTEASYYSNYNKNTDSSTTDNNVDVVAPGCVYTANVPQKAPRTSSSSGVADSYYLETQGTSFASPLTAGAIALYRAKYPNKTRTEVIEALHESCYDIGTSGWDKTFGFGRVDVSNFLDDDEPGQEDENETYNISYVTTSNNEGINLVTDASKLKAGDQIYIASNTSGKVAGNLSSQYFSSVSATFSNDKKQITSSGSGILLTLGGNSSAWTLSNSNGQKIGATAVKKLSWNSGSTTWTISISNGDATIQNKTASYGRFLYNVQSPRFTTYTSATSNQMLLPQIYKVETGSSTETLTWKVSDTLANICLEMDSYITCDPTGVNSSINWSLLETSFSSVSTGELEVLETAISNENGNVVEQFLSKYDYIVSKYGYKDFLNRDVASSLKTYFVSENNNSSTLILVISASVISLTLICVFKKRKNLKTK